MIKKNFVDGMDPDRGLVRGTISCKVSLYCICFLFTTKCLFVYVKMSFMGSSTRTTITNHMLRSVGDTETEIFHCKFPPLIG